MSVEEGVDVHEGLVDVDESVLQESGLGNIFFPIDGSDKNVEAVVSKDDVVPNFRISSFEKGYYLCKNTKI